MQLPTQEQFVKDCLAKYRWESLPADQKWEEAHFPLPQCSGEGDTVKLWSADHTVQGLLQSVEFDHKCFHGYRTEHDRYLLTEYYPEYLELFAQLTSQFSRRQGKKGGKKAVELKVGIHAPGMASKGGKKGGKIAGKKAAELKLGIHAPGMLGVGGKIGGPKGGKKTAELGIGIHGQSAEQMSAAGKKSAAQKWQCLVTGHICNAGPLSRYQKARGIDTSLRKRVY